MTETTGSGGFAARPARDGLGWGALAAGTWALQASLALPGLEALGILGLTGCAAVVAGPTLFALRERPPDARDWAALSGIAAATVPLWFLARFLKEKTHHRPLGGVTFALIALAVIALGAIIARRLFELADERGIGRHVMRLLGVVGGLGLVVAGASSLGTAGWSALGPQAAWLTICVVVAHQLGRKVRLPGAGVGVWAMLVLAGIGVALFRPAAMFGFVAPG